MYARMKPIVFVFVLFAWAAWPNFSALAQTSAPPPYVELAFDQALARAGASGMLEVKCKNWKPVYETYPETYTVTHKVAVQVENPETKQLETHYKDVSEQKTATRTVMKMVSEDAIRFLDWKEATVTEIGGDAVKGDVLRERLKTPTLVIVSFDGKPLPDSFAMLFKTGTLVLDLSQPKAIAQVPVPLPPAAIPAPLPAAPAPAPAPVPQQVPMPAPATPKAPATIEAGASVVGDAPKQDAFAFPNAAPPMFRLASIDEQGQFALKVTAVAEKQLTRFVTKCETHVIDGKEVQVCKCVPVSVTERFQGTSIVAVPAEMVSGATVEGKPMTDQHRAALKVREIPVVVSRNGLPVEAFWLQNIKPKMLTLVPPANQPPAATPLPVPATVAPPSGR